MNLVKRDERRGPDGLAGLPSQAQAGQAILLIALLMVVLIGFTALAVDGGSLFLTERNARNAADAAVLAATYELCKTGDPADADPALVEQAALAAAADNHFNNDGITNTVTVQHPPTDGDIAADLASASESVKSEYIQVVIQADAPTYLIHFVYQGPSEVTARAVGHCRRERPAFAGYALVALNDAVNVKGIHGGGTGTITINNAGALSNSTNPSASITVDGGASLQAEGPIDTAGGFDEGESISPTPNHIEQTVPDPLANLPEPPNPGNCQPQIKLSSSETSGTFGPGCYAGLKLNAADKTIYLEPGLYYFTDDVSIEAGNLIAENVMIFMKDGGFSATGGDLTLTAVTTGEWAGMLLYSSRDNDSSSEAIKFTAQGVQIITGTVYAPNVDLELAGGADDDVTGQFIASTVKVTGSGDFEINYDEDVLYKIPPELTFVQ